MIVVADGGSTKVHWRTLDGSVDIVSRGLNPLTCTEDEIEHEFRSVCNQITPSAIYFFGAGCGNERGRNTMTRILSSVFASAAIHVAGDIDGACLAVCGAEDGWVGILGTGSNVCHFNGSIVDRRSLSLGYLLGDEGSANNIGRKLLESYLRSSMPDYLLQYFSEMYKKSHEQWIEELYTSRQPNRMLGQLAQFAFQFRNEQFVSNLLRSAFDDFFVKQVAPLGCSGTLHLVGSVAYLFRDEIECVAHSRGYTIGTVLRNPIEGMVAYFHSRYASLDNDFFDSIITTI